jgi:uncharacterized protein (DUF1800 family)
MLPAKPDSYRIALNRVTFGARDLDVAAVSASGWSVWLNDQLAPPVGDDPQLDAHLKSQVMHIEYPASTAANTQGTWAAVKEDRPLNFLNADTPTLWNVAIKAGVSIAFNERQRIRQELAAATWIRNTHSRYQLREFMTDFWHNHFNIGKNENELATALLPVYDRVAIRPHVFGNFRTMLEANATSSSMLMYLDNWVSNATTPNENYAREIMELHTLGGAAYDGTTAAANVPSVNGVAVAFTDQDIIQASRALSGWTVQYGQRFGNVQVPSTGEFIYNAAQHNTQAGLIFGVNVAALSAPMAQGRKFLDTIAYHPATATFICTKLAKRIFGDTPPQAVIDRAVVAWKDNQTATDQIARVLRAILLDGDEVFTAPVTKMRRPYERLIALARTTDMVLSASTIMTGALDPLNDGLFAWQAPNGRPDTNGYWLATGAMVTTWNLMLQLPYLKEIKTTLADQTPLDAASSATGVVEYWVGRMVGAQLSSAAMDVLVYDQSGNLGVPNLVTRGNSALVIESAYRRLISLIATAEEFSLR